jgi:hypothetical protein
MQYLEKFKKMLREEKEGVKTYEKLVHDLNRDGYHSFAYIIKSEILVDEKEHITILKHLVG